MGIERDFADAIQSIRPGAQWTIRGPNYSDLEWLDGGQAKPTQQEVTNAILAVQASRTSEAQRQAGIKGDMQRAAMLNRLSTASNAQIDNWVASNVTNLAEVRSAIGMILKLIALDNRS